MYPWVSNIYTYIQGSCYRCLVHGYQCLWPTKNRQLRCNQCSQEHLNCTITPFRCEDKRAPLQTSADTPHTPAPKRQRVATSAAVDTAEPSASQPRAHPSQTHAPAAAQDNDASTPRAPSPQTYANPSEYLSVGEREDAFRPAGESRPNLLGALNYQPMPIVSPADVMVTHPANYREMLQTAVAEFESHVGGMTQGERQRALLSHWREQDMRRLAAVDDQLRIVHAQMQMLEAVRTELGHERLYRRGTVAVADHLLGPATSWIVPQSDVAPPAPTAPTETPAPPNTPKPEMPAHVPTETRPPPRAQTPAATSPPKTPDADAAASPATHAPRPLFLHDPEEEDEGEDEVEKEEANDKKEHSETAKAV